ncbi:MAG: hypothetical protein C0600_07330 [Ignavibacteria bacterium]|nr:MAG: hypothetical protein C0600_07330 [Ignavibacteria bacterium]
MKTTFFAMIAAVMLFAACGSEAENAADDTKQEDGTEQMEATQASFYCPMKCEGEKTYTENVGCPVCGMDLVEVGDGATDSHEGHDHGDHEGHDH